MNDPDLTQLAEQRKSLRSRAHELHLLESRTPEQRAELAEVNAALQKVNRSLGKRAKVDNNARVAKLRDQLDMLVETVTALTDRVRALEAQQAPRAREVERLESRDGPVVVRRRSVR